MNEEIVHGTNIDYINLIGYVESNDMGNDIVENAIENWVDIESFLSYFAFQIFIDNRDWPGNNIKFWKPFNDENLIHVYYYKRILFNFMKTDSIVVF